MKPGLKYLLTLATLLFATTASAYPDESAIKITVKPEEKIVKNDNDLLVAVSIKNTGKIEQVLHIWNCALYDNWTTDDPSITVTQTDCARNDLMNLILKPGETHKEILSLHVSIIIDGLPAKPLPSTFRLGFQQGRYPTDTMNQYFPLIWSEPVTVKVKFVPENPSPIPHPET